ncbi:hypothetical protein SAMN05216562_1573 [Microbulbifer marinus]|uniref:Uncharacterized protein n=1 Tax=Microbulbifer marinus TaxID=658218 RepID=A0A1H3XIW7_9GAMM|nr:hypothetical protein SAMN05216562_1573 [Microbulbifer marinus]
MAGNNEPANRFGTAHEQRSHSLFVYLVAAQAQSLRLAASLTNTDAGLAPAGRSLVRRGENR